MCQSLASAAIAAAVLLLSACQTATVSEPGTAMAATETELMAEATAFGAAQGAAGLAAGLDPTGVASMGAMVAGSAAHKAWMASAHTRMKAAQEADLQATYKKYGMNPDGTPSGKPGPGSAQ